MHGTQEGVLRFLNRTNQKDEDQSTITFTPRELCLKYLDQLKFLDFPNTGDYGKKVTNNKIVSEKLYSLATHYMSQEEKYQKKWLNPCIQQES